MFFRLVCVRSYLEAGLEIHLLYICIMAIVIKLHNSKTGLLNAYLKKKNNCLFSFCKKGHSVLKLNLNLMILWTFIIIIKIMFQCNRKKYTTEYNLLVFNLYHISFDQIYIVSHKMLLELTLMR